MKSCSLNKYFPKPTFNNYLKNSISPPDSSLYQKLIKGRSKNRMRGTMWSIRLLHAELSTLAH